MCNLNGYKELAEKARYMYNACHTYFMGTGENFVIDFYRFWNLLLCYIHLPTHYYYYFIEL